MNRGAPTPELPASGGTKVLKPGMNFAATTPRIPYRVKRSCVRRTHESGSSEMRQRRFNTRLPPLSSQIKPDQIGERRTKGGGAERHKPIGFARGGQSAGR